MIFPGGMIHIQHHHHWAAFSVCLVPWCYQIPSFPIQGKITEPIINALPSTGRRATRLTEKNMPLQPGTTENRTWVMRTDGFRMPPYTLPRVTSRSPIFTDVWNMFCVWNPFTPRMREPIWPEIENVYILFKNIIKWMFRNQLAKFLSIAVH